MNYTLTFILFILGVGSCVNAPVENDRFLDDNVTLLRQFELKGKAKNLPSDIESRAEMDLSETYEGHFQGKGKFDNKRLFGKFEIEGDVYHEPDLTDVLCIELSGTIKYGGDDGSGIDLKTEKPFSVDLKIFEDNATGEWIIHDTGNHDDSNTNQNGLFEFKIKSVEYLDVEGTDEELL